MATLPSAISQALTGRGALPSSTGPYTFFRGVSDYLERVLPHDSTMKVLLVDTATLNIISMSFTQTALLTKGVFLVDHVAASRQRRTMKRMRCIIFIRPEAASVDAACTEIRKAKYERYTIILCGATSTELLHRLAVADAEQMLVSSVEEVFCDFCAVNNDAFLMEPPPPQRLVSALVSASQVQRIAEGLAALCVAQRRRPHIRVLHSSPLARRVAAALLEILKGNAQLYDYRPQDTVLLLTDRAEDPLTPLLTPWTYQAMLHEHVGIDHNKLQLPAEARPTGDGAEDAYVFSQHDDVFFAGNLFSNWGDLCNNVKTYVDKCKAALNLDRSTATMDEIKEFMQRIPQTRSLTGSVTKHATVTTHLSHVVKGRNLLEVSLLEQDMVSSSNMNEHWARLQNFAAAAVDPQDLLRLCLIFHLRYEAAGARSKTVPMLDQMSSTHHQLLVKLREYYGKTKSTEELFAATGVMATIVKTFVDVGNIYTQHEPVLKRTLMQLFKGELDTTRYPYATKAPPANCPGGALQQPSYKPKEAIVFMCGGFTYAEAALVDAVNKQTAYKPADMGGFMSPPRVSLGGDAVLNSATFIESLSNT